MFNERPFEKREESRNSVFLQEELPFLQPLPSSVYEYADWNKATVALDYHVCVDHEYYSVPYPYVHKTVDVRLTSTMVEIFYQHAQIAAHARLYGPRHQYSTMQEHMPQNHQLYDLWDGQRFLRWAKKVGPATKKVIQAKLKSYPVEEQAYRSCIAHLKLSEKVLYIRLPELFDEYHHAVIQDKREECLRKIQKFQVLIIDEFLLYKATEEQADILLEILERRISNTTIVCSQYAPGGWVEQLGNSAVADAVLDRLTSNAHVIQIDGDTSMRKRYATC